MSWTWPSSNVTRLCSHPLAPSVFSDWISSTAAVNGESHTDDDGAVSQLAPVISRLSSPVATTGALLTLTTAIASAGLAVRVTPTTPTPTGPLWSGVPASLERACADLFTRAARGETTALEASGLVSGAAVLPLLPTELQRLFEREPKQLTWMLRLLYTRQVSWAAAASARRGGSQKFTPHWALAACSGS